MLAMAAVLATIEAIETDKMRENISDIENYLRERLKEIEEVKLLRGKGGLFGIEFAGELQTVSRKTSGKQNHYGNFVAMQKCCDFCRRCA